MTAIFFLLKPFDHLTKSRLFMFGMPIKDGEMLNFNSANTFFIASAGRDIMGVLRFLFTSTLIIFIQTARCAHV